MLERQEAGGRSVNLEIVGVYSDHWKILVLAWKVELSYKVSSSV